MLMMRLQRIGRKNSPSYRVVVTDKRESTKSNRFAEIVGTYEPKSGAIALEADRIKYWLSNGVQASPTVHNMLVSKKVISDKKINVLPKMKNRKVEEPKVEEAPAPVAEAPAAPVAEVTPEEAPATPEVAAEAPAEAAA
jgi:small subunit ribosomal protein S16